MKKGGSRNPPSLTSFHFSPVFLRSMAEGGGRAVFGFPSTWCACAPSRALCIPESRRKGTVRRARLGGGEGKGVMHLGS